MIVQKKKNRIFFDFKGLCREKLVEKERNETILYMNFLERYESDVER